MESSPKSISETVERLRVVSAISSEEFLDLLGITWPAYTLFRMGIRELPEASVHRLAEQLGVTAGQILDASVDFRAIQSRAEKSKVLTPEKYLKARHGRARTTITSFEYIEQRYGWRLRYDALKRLEVGEGTLVNEFAPISIAFITDACAYLHRRRFRESDFFAMGAYSFDGNAHSILASLLGEQRSAKDVLEMMWGVCLPLFERNCIYRFLRLDDDGGLLDVQSDPQVAAEMGVRHLGNEHVCALKAGMMSTGPCYMGDIPARVREVRCVHKGADSCQFEMKFANRSGRQATFMAG